MTAERYREQAAELRAQAARTKNGSVREQLLLMAHDWDKLAGDLEELERRKTSQAR